MRGQRRGHAHQRDAGVYNGGADRDIGVFDRIGRYAGGGTIVPITGFANSIASAAMEYRSEGFIMGVGARMFQIAGPVLVYGIGSSVVVGIIYYIIDLIWGI